MPGQAELLGAPMSALPQPCVFAQALPLVERPLPEACPMGALPVVTPRALSRPHRLCPCEAWACPLVRDS